MRNAEAYDHLRNTGLPHSDATAELRLAFLGRGKILAYSTAAKFTVRKLAVR